MNYGYVRVSTIGQNIDRQMDEMYRLGLEKKCIYVDKQSGKDFERPSFKKLKKMCCCTSSFYLLLFLLV